MKALTLWQPWATLVAKGSKQFETRSWGTSYRGPLAIHAAKALPKSWAFMRDDHFGEALDHVCGVNEMGVPDIAKLPTGAVLAVAMLVDVVRISGVPYDPVPGYGIGDSEMAFGDYTPGRYAWVMDEVYELPVPVEASGRQRLWNLGMPQVLAIARGDADA